MATTNSRSVSEILYIGVVLVKFCERKLPVALEVMQVFFFYQHKCLNKSMSVSGWHTTREIIIFWTEKCRIPVIMAVHVFEKVKRLFLRVDTSEKKSNAYIYCTGKKRIRV